MSSDTTEATQDGSDVVLESGFDPESAGGRMSRRRFFMLAVVAVFLVGGLAWALWWSLVGRYAETTEDAYVGGDVVQITPQVAGTVLSVAADDTDFVTAGQPLVELDRSDGRVALERAEAELARAARQVRGLMASAEESAARVAQRRSELERARADQDRRERARPSGAVAEEEIQHARNAVVAAGAGLEAAEQALNAQRAVAGRTAPDMHPEVGAAAARVCEAWLAYARSAITAPVSGYVARRSVQVGQRVAPGVTLMSVVPLERVWVDANFKEVQLQAMRIGQPVEVIADLYGSDVVFHGRVAGFGAGTGSAFALLPSQNATGNWIKIVQRVPVRVALDPSELARHPLQIGLSMQVKVDTHTRDGERMPRQARIAPPHLASGMPALDEVVTKRIAAIIAAQAAPRER